MIQERTPEATAFRKFLSMIRQEKSGSKEQGDNSWYASNSVTKRKIPCVLGLLRDSIGYSVHHVINLANDPTYEEEKHALKARMEDRLREQSDPRMRGEGQIFDEYPVTSGAGFYERWSRGEKPEATWVNASDFETRQSPVVR